MPTADVAALILAAGRASRFGAGAGGSKVLAIVDGTPMVRRVAMTALESRAAPVLVVTGHAGEAVAAALDGLPVGLVANPDWASGMARSLAAGLNALPRDVIGAVILLADMPLVQATTLDRLIEAFEEGTDAVVPRYRGQTGNPVLIGRTLFAELALACGDVGARKLLASGDRRVVFVEVDDFGIAIDVDTRDGLEALARQAAERSAVATDGAVSDQASSDRRASIASADRGGAK